MVVGEDFHFVENRIRVQSQTVCRESVEQLIVQFFFIGSFSYQFGGDYIKIRVGAVVREVAGVGHYASEQALGRIAVDFIEEAYAAHEVKQQAASGAQLGVRYNHSSVDVWIQVVVDEYFWRFRCLNDIGDASGTVDGVEVEADDEVGFFYKFSCEIGMLRSIDKVFGARQALEVVESLVGDNSLYVFAD